MSLVSRAHHRRAERAAMPEVAAAQHLGDDRLAAVAGLVGDGVGEVRIERLLEQVDRLEPVLAQLAEHQVQQRSDLVGMLDVGGFGGVEHRQQRFGEASGGAVDLGSDLRRRALAVVVEVGLQPLGDVLELVALVGELVDLAVDGVGELVVDVVVADVVVGAIVALPELFGDVRSGRELTLDVVDAVEPRQIVVRLAHWWLSSSSTTSASTISSSLTEPAPDDPPVWPEADVPAALASRDAAS